MRLTVKWDAGDGVKIMPGNGGGFDYKQDPKLQEAWKSLMKWRGYVSEIKKQAASYHATAHKYKARGVEHEYPLEKWRIKVKGDAWLAFASVIESKANQAWADAVYSVHGKNIYMYWGLDGRCHVAGNEIYVPYDVKYLEEDGSMSIDFIALLNEWMNMKLPQL